MLPLWLHHRTAIHPAVVPADQGDFVDLPGTDECVETILEKNAV